MNSVKDIKNWRILNTDNYFIGVISEYTCLGLQKKTTKASVT